MVKSVPVPSPPLPASKRFRPPRIDLSRTVERKANPIIHVDPVLHIPDSDSSTFEESLQLSDSDTSDSDIAGATSPSSGLRVPSSSDDLPPDDLSRDFAELQQLRKNVKKNLKLRPIRSRSNLPKINLTSDNEIDSIVSRPPFVSSHFDDSKSVLSPTSAVSSYFTPVDVTPFTSVFSANHPTSPFPPLSASSALPISAHSLSERLNAPKRPLLIDTRVVATYLSFHLRHSVNVVIPSLILKRCRKPGGGLQSIDALRQFVTTSQGIKHWDYLMAPGGPWDGNVVVYDEEMNPKDKDRFAWCIIPVIQQLLASGNISYLDGGISNAAFDPDLRNLIMTGEEDKIPEELGSSQIKVDSTLAPPVLGGKFAKRKASLGLFQLDTNAVSRSSKLPEIEPSSTTSTNPSSPLPTIQTSTPPSLHSIQTVKNPDSPFLSLDASTATPSPPPSAVGFKKPQSRRPSVPNLRKIDTASAERLRDVPRLSVRTKPMRSATLCVPPSLSLSVTSPHSPTHLSLKFSNLAPPPRRLDLISPTELTPYYTPLHTPRRVGFDLPDPPHTPLTVRPEMEPPTTEEVFPAFTISTILPNFLFLGPELTTHEHVAELKSLGVKRILNIAIECDDDNGLHLREVFEKYHKIPMRDTVEEDNIARGVREVCDILDDARLHSAPTYVHCKAGKSRSVTAVIAYLIHANHWTLSRAYSFVVERRKGISPNIGFVSELMNFEEQELGGKSIGVQPGLASGGLKSGSSTSHDNEANEGSSFGVGEPLYPMPSANHRRAGHHIRESLPPALGMDGLGAVGGPMSALEAQVRVLLGDSAHETEVKDATGRYRHARRAPVDETTLQPMRRASKAGLESSFNLSP